jgi:hypothetical protein
MFNNPSEEGEILKYWHNFKCNSLANGILFGKIFPHRVDKCLAWPPHQYGENCVSKSRRNVML